MRMAFKTRKTKLADEWREWMSEEGHRLVAYARHRTGSQDEAEDVVQDALIRLWGYQEERGHCPPDIALAFSVIRYVAMDAGRKKGRRQKGDQKIIQLHDPEEHWLDLTVEQDEDALQLRKAIDGLSDKLKEVIMLKIWSGLTFAQIGEVLKISQNTAASRYRYALELLQLDLQELKEERNG